MGSGKEPLRVAILTSADQTWALEVWRETIPPLRQRHRVVGMFLFPERQGRRKGWEIPWWYARTFGWWTVVLLGLFALRRRIDRVLSGVGGWDELARRYRVRLARFERVNDPAVVRSLRRLKPDVVLIMVGEILKPPVLGVARVGVINKHAALLPACRGVFPFLWSVTSGVSTGVSFHRVDEGIDTGPVLLRRRLGSASWSMVQFYREVFRRFPRMVMTAMDRLVEGSVVEPDSSLRPSSFGYPTRRDVAEFRRRGGRIVRVSDLVGRG